VCVCVCVQEKISLSYMSDKGCLERDASPVDMSVLCLVCIASIHNVCACETRDLPKEASGASRLLVSYIPT